MSQEAIDVHLRRVGCRTTGEYLAWCEREGARASLIKGQREQEREIQLYQRVQARDAMNAARRLSRHPDEVLRLISEGNAPANLLARPYLARVDALFAQTRRKNGGSARTRQAFLRLLLYTQPLARFDDMDPVVGYERAGNTYADALFAIAAHERAWIRPLEEWHPRSRSTRRQFSELVSHLFCRYPTPGFLESAWFRAWPSPHVGPVWYTRAGTGMNLRDVGAPIALTKRMAHIGLTQTPGDLTVEQGFRWAQVRGMGGSERLARAIIVTFLGERFEDEAFWETVLRFFVDNPLLDGAQVGPLCDYLRWERTTPHRAGDSDRLPLNFTMKGRTATALVARMERWHKQTAHETRLRQETWPACGIGGWPSEALEHRSSPWHIRELLTTKELAAEGRAMSHCVATYAPNCARGSTSVWSVTFDSGVGPERVMTVAVSRDGTITEARGKRNALPATGQVGLWGTRLSERDTHLLLDARGVVRQWAMAERLKVPGYLL